VRPATTTPPRRARYRLAVDVGGTFTDLILTSDGDRDARLEKVPTTPDEVTRGVIGVIEKAGVEVSDIVFFLHGTTLGLNAFLQRRGETTGLITTSGFRDVLEIARMDRPNMYDMLYEKPPSLVPRSLRLEITGRMNAAGEILEPLDRDSVLDAVKTLKREDVTAVAVCLLHAYANPDHELAVEAVFAEAYPEATVSLSHVISQEYYEYERTVSTVVNASIKRLMAEYVSSLEDRLQDGNFGGTFLILRSSGGAMVPAEVRRTPVQTLLSGPSGGVMGAVRLGKATGFKNLITADAGGTSLDVSLITGGEPTRRSQAVLADYKLLLPVLDIQSIGAGGGSIAWIDDGGALQVGPASAGSTPGPICYGGGGTEPTVTDAAVVLGYIDERNFFGGQMLLDRAASERGIAERLGGPLGLTTVEVACGILAIATTKMSGVIRTMTVERGHDPRIFTLVGFGGAGPMFAAAIAAWLNARQTLIPRFPGSFSAWGMLSTDLAYDFAKTELHQLDQLAAAEANGLFERLEVECRAAFERDSVAPSAQKLLRSVDARYAAQGHFINLPVPKGTLDEAFHEDFEERFHRTHKRVFGHRLDEPVVLATFRVRGIGHVPKVPVPRIDARTTKQAPKAKSTRQLLDFTTRKRHQWSIYDRDELLAGDRLPGPAIIEEVSSVSIVPPDQQLVVDDFGNLLISRTRDAA
jgi:N-methylhydantoinase A